MANLEDIISARSGEYQLNNAEIVSTANWTWNQSTNTLTWDASAYLSIPSMNLSSNFIPAGSLTLNSGYVAYVLANINSNSPTTLTIYTVSDPSLLPKINDLYVIARRDSGDILLDGRYRLTDGQSFKVGQIPNVPPGMVLSVQTSSFTAEKNKSYYVSCASGPVSITLPTSSLTDNIIRFTDIDKTWGNTNLVTINAGSNNIFYNNQTSTSLILDVAGTWIEMAWDSINSRWATRDAYYPLVNQLSGDLVINGNLSVTGINATTYKIISSAYTALHGDVLMANTTSSGFIVSLPLNPSPGQNVTIFDAKGTFASNSLTVSRNGSNINGLAQNITLSTNKSKTLFVYIDSTIGWSTFA